MRARRRHDHLRVRPREARGGDELVRREIAELFGVVDVCAADEVRARLEEVEVSQERFHALGYPNLECKEGRVQGGVAGGGVGQRCASTEAWTGAVALPGQHSAPSVCQKHSEEYAQQWLALP